MKTIYNVKALCVVALLGSAAAASAQEDVTKEKNLNREMTLEREYDPSVQDASKVNTLPVVKEPEVRNPDRLLELYDRRRSAERD